MARTKLVKRLIISGCVVGVLVAMVLSTRFVGAGSDLPTNDSSAQGLDPKAWAQANYDSQVVPAITSKAVPWATLIKALDADPDNACAQFGQQEKGANSCSYATTITGTLADGNFGELAIVSPDTPSDVTVGFQIGPAIVGTALRDASGLLDFGMFQNQTAYQQAGTELNNIMKAELLANFDATAAVGKSYTIVGAFAWDGTRHVTITTVSLEAAS